MSAKIAFGAGILVAAVLFLVPAEPDRDARRSPVRDDIEVPIIAPLDLSARLLGGGADLLVIDVRAVDVADSGMVRGAMLMPLEALDAGRIAVLPADRRIVVYGADEAESRAAWSRIAAARPHAAVLRGGYAGWRQEVLEPAEPAADASAEAWAEYRRHRAVADFYLGRSTDAPSAQPARVLQPVLRPRPTLGAGEGC